jgi:CheY-like chemotaxis protein
MEQTLIEHTLEVSKMAEKKEFSLLLAEDDPGHSALIKKNLARMGFKSRIYHFSNGEELLDFLKNDPENPKNRPDRLYMLLLDIKMPKIDGIEVLKIIKQDPDLKKIPVIMLTSVKNPQDKKICKNLGCNDYIVKPLEYKSFVNVVQDKVSSSLLMSIFENYPTDSI